MLVVILIDYIIMAGLFRTEAEPLIVQIILLIRNITMACLFCTEIRRDSRLFSHFVSLHA